MLLLPFCPLGGAHVMGVEVIVVGLAGPAVPASLAGVTTLALALALALALDLDLDLDEIGAAGGLLLGQGHHRNLLLAGLSRPSPVPNLFDRLRERLHQVLGAN